MIVDFLASVGLLMGKQYLYLPLLIGGFFIHKDKEHLYAHGLILLLFTIIYNYWLKSIWQVPLPEELHKEGWAFPSGHMHSAFVLWGWFLMHCRHTFTRIVVGSMLLLLAFGLVYRGFHFPLDVFAAMGFGIITLSLYSIFLKLKFFHDSPEKLSGLLTIGSTVLLVACIPIAHQGIWLWQVQGALLGLSSGLFIFQPFFKTAKRIPRKTYALFLIPLIGISVYYSFDSFFLPFAELFGIGLAVILIKVGLSKIPTPNFISKYSA